MKKLKLLPLLFLALLCACLLTGCGKEKTEEPSEATESGMIYTSSFTPIPWNQENGLDPLTVTEDGFYASCYEKQPGAEDEYRQTIYYVNQKRHINKIPKDLPILLISGDLDPVGNLGKGVKSVYNKYVEAGITDIECHLFEGMRHEILNEPRKAETYDYIREWLSRH